MKQRNFFRVLLVLAASTIGWSDAYGFESDNLDVNLNPIYLGTRAHKNTNIQSDVVFQVPLAVTKKAEETGLGPVASLAYFDSKALMHIRTDSVTVRGVGRFYYFVTAYGTPNTFVPYVTLYRDTLIGYKNLQGRDAESKTKSWLPPGFLYAHRMNDRVVLHTEAELYSYARPTNRVIRLGAAYEFSQSFIVSTSYERLSWDIKDSMNSNLSMKGKSDNLYLKIMNSKPLKDNFAFIIGYASNQNSPGTSLPGQLSAGSTRGIFFGIEASLGTLVW